MLSALFGVTVIVYWQICTSSSKQTSVNVVSLECFPDHMIISFNIISLFVKKFDQNFLSADMMRSTKTVA